VFPVTCRLGPSWTRGNGTHSLAPPRVPVVRAGDDRGRPRRGRRGGSRGAEWHGRIPEYKIIASE
jgi:hypothetical protein